MTRKTILRTFNTGGVAYPYSEFLGEGLPPMDLGESGDVYVDLTPGSLALYGRCSDKWKIWRGPQNRKTEELVVHPLHPNRCLWCSDSSFGWFGLRFAQGRLSVHSTASDALSAAQDAQIEKKAKKRKAKEKIELQEPTPAKRRISPTKSAELNSNLSKIPASTHPLLQAVDAHPDLTCSSSVGSLNSLPPPLQHPTELFDISTFTCESSASPRWPILWPYGATHLFEADSNRPIAVQYAQGHPYPVESGQTSPDTLPDKYSQVSASRSPATLLEQPHQRTKVVEHSQTGLHIVGLSPSTLSIPSGDVALPGGVTAKQPMQSGEPLPPTANAEPPIAEPPGRTHTSVDMVEQSPRLTTGDTPIAVPSTSQLTLPSPSHSGITLSGCDHRTFQDKNQRHKRIELHAASERAAQRIREADKEIERLRGENVILRNQLHDNVRVRATHATLPTLGITDGYTSKDAGSIDSSPRTTPNLSPDDPPKLEITCAPSPRIPDISSPTSRHELILEVSAAKISSAISDDTAFPCNPMTISHPLQEGNNSIGPYSPQAALPPHRFGGEVHELNNSGKSSLSPNLSMPISFKEADLDILMSDPALTAVDSEVPSPHFCIATESVLIIDGPVVTSGPPPKLDSPPETPELVSSPEVPRFTGGTLEPLVAISPSVLAKAGDDSLSISPTSAATLEAEGDALSRNGGDTLNQTEIGIVTLADDQDFAINSSSFSSDPQSWLTEIHTSILFADERDFMVCRICLGTSEDIFQVDKTGVASQHVKAIMQQHCDERHPDEIQILINLTGVELCDVRDRLHCISEGKG